MGGLRETLAASVSPPLWDPVPPPLLLPPSSSRWQWPPPPTLARECSGGHGAYLPAPECPGVVLGDAMRHVMRQHSLSDSSHKGTFCVNLGFMGHIFGMQLQLRLWWRGDGTRMAMSCRCEGAGRAVDDCCCCSGVVGIVTWVLRRNTGGGWPSLGALCGLADRPGLIMGSKLLSEAR
jgi:hypothetical protein